MGSVESLIRKKQAHLGATLAVIAATNVAGCQQTTAHIITVTRPNGKPSNPRYAPPSDSTVPGTWQICKPMNRGAVFAGTVALPNGRIFVISGRTTDNGIRKITNVVRVYDPLQNTWTEVSPIPTPRTQPGAAVGGDGKIYVMGGGDPQRQKNIVEVYDPRTDTWARRHSMPTPREGLSAVAAKGADGRRYPGTGWAHLCDGRL